MLTLDGLVVTSGLTRAGEGFFVADPAGGPRSGLYVYGGAGDDSMEGGGGQDALLFLDDPAGVTVDLTVRDHGRQVAGGVTAPVAEPVEAEVAGDSEEPGDEGPVGVEFGALLVDADEDFLGDVVGIGGVAEEAVAEVEDRVFVAAHQFVERGIGVGLQPCNKL